jgi:BirA family biotin operon repressor/biotin-[acetyl-CoA-carboxylase] ligase
MRETGPELPPLLAGRDVSETAEPFEEACSLAPAGEASAGDFFWSRSEKRAACAITLEPDVPLARCLQMAPVLQAAVIDCLASLLPPRIPVALRWPDAILVNNAVAGRTRLAVPAVRMAHVPDWLVVGFHVQLVFDASHEPGLTPGETALSEEGGADLSRDAVLKSFASHFLAWLNTWQSDGFRPVQEHWLHLAEGWDEPAGFSVDGLAVKARVKRLGHDLRLVVVAADGSEHRLSMADMIERREPRAASASSRIC